MGRARRPKFLQGHRARDQECLQLIGRIKNQKSLQLILEGKEDRAEALRRAYEKDGFRGLLEALNQLWGDSQHAEDHCPDQVAGNYALIGDKENAFLWLDKAYTDNDKITCGNLLPVQVDPFLDNIRSDPRYNAFLRRAA